MCSSEYLGGTIATQISSAINRSKLLIRTDKAFMTLGETNKEYSVVCIVEVFSFLLIHPGELPPSLVSEPLKPGIN